MNDTKKLKKMGRYLIMAFCAWLFSSIVFGCFIYSFNHTLRTYDSGIDSSAFMVNMEPRTGQTDSWPKLIEENGETVEYKGTIYDLTVKNIGDLNISYWKLRIDIKQDLYLNNAWCGTFEVHQFVDGVENIQNIDLRNYNEADLKLQYKMTDQDLMIPLKKGDYIIYYPDLSASEYPIYHGSSNKLTEVVFGVIFYEIGDTPFSLESYHMNYYLQKDFVQSPMFFLQVICLIIWLIALIIYITAAINIKNANVRYQEDEHIISQSIGVFTRFFEAKDTYTNGHSERVAEYSKLIAAQLNFDDNALRNIYYIALMHDCGKCYIPDSILKKPGRLTKEEFEIIKSHTVKGAEMIEDFTSIDHIRDGVLYHHERYDGKGYPEGLKGEQIPLIARIICVADSFDAMNSKRCYRNQLSMEYIITELEDNREKQFDPEIVDIFLKLLKTNKISQ